MGSSPAEIAIREALVELLRHGKKHSFVFIEEPQSQKFVQFGKGRCLEMDVPCAALTSDEADSASEFYRELGEDYPKEYHAPDPKTGKTRHGATFNHDFGQDTEAAAEAAVAFFLNVYRVSPDAEFFVEER